MYETLLYVIKKLCISTIIIPLVFCENYQGGKKAAKQAFLKKEECVEHKNSCFAVNGKDSKDKLKIVENKKRLKLVQKIVLGVSAVCLILTMFVPPVLAGAPFGEMIPKGMDWIRFYEVYTSTKKQFDNDGNKSSFPDGVEHAHTIDYVHGVTDDLFVGCSIPYYEAVLRGPVNRMSRSQGLGNIKVGGQYRYYKTDSLGLAFRFAVKLPTGEPDDPNNNDDMARGSEDYTLEFYNFIDYFFMEKTYVLSGQVRYNWRLENEYNQIESRRTTAGEVYKKDPGNEFWLAVGFQRNNFLTPGLSPSLRFEARYHGRDDYNSNDSVWDDSKEEDTSTTLYFLQPEVRYSFYTKFKVPVRIYANYRIPLRGRNTYVTERIEAGVDLFF